jgi:hypothetical protein
VLGAFLSETTRRGDHIKLGERIDLTYDVMNSEALIGAEMIGRKGRIVVSRELTTSCLHALFSTYKLVCVDNRTSSQIRKAARRSSRNCIHLKELPFHPVEEPRLKEIVKAAAEFGRAVLNQVQTHSI